MVHIIALGKESEEMRKALLRHIAKDGDILYVHFFCQKITPNANYLPAFKQVGTFSDLCSFYLTEHFIFDPQLFMHEYMLSVSQIPENTLKPVFVKSTVQIDSPVTLFIRQVCDVLSIPNIYVDTATFEDNFFDEQKVHKMLQWQIMQYDRFCSSLTEEQWAKLPVVCRNMDMNFLMDDWTGLMRYIIKKKIVIVGRDNEKSLLHGKNIFFECTDEHIEEAKALLCLLKRDADNICVWHCLPNGIEAEASSCLPLFNMNENVKKGFVVPTESGNYLFKMGA